MPITYRKGRLLKTIRSCCKGRDSEGLECYGVVTQQRNAIAFPNTQYKGNTERTAQTAPRTKYCCPSDGRKYHRSQNQRQNAAANREGKAKAGKAGAFVIILS